MVVTAIAVPKRPASWKVEMMPPTMTSAGSAVDFERHGEALDHVGAMTGDRRLGDRHHRALARAGVVLGDVDDRRRHGEADEAAQEQRVAGDLDAVGLADHAPAVRQEVRGEGEAADRQDAGDDEALVERAHDRVVGAELDEVRAGDRGHDARRADGERIHHGGEQRGLPGEEDRAQNHGGDDRHRVGLEQVGRHAGAVADVVADVVGDGRRVARIIFRNAGFHLAHEVGADVGALGEDAAAKTREDRDQRGAEAKGHQRVDDGAAVGRETAGPVRSQK